MTYLEKIEVVFSIMEVMGFVLVIGAVGTADYMDEIGQYQSFDELLKSFVPGLLMMIPYAVFEHVMVRWHFYDRDVSATKS